MLVPLVEAQLAQHLEVVCRGTVMTGHRRRDASAAATMAIAAKASSPLRSVCNAEDTRAASPSLCVSMNTSACSPATRSSPIALITARSRASTSVVGSVLPMTSAAWIATLSAHARVVSAVRSIAREL